MAKTVKPRSPSAQGPWPVSERSRHRRLTVRQRFGSPVYLEPTGLLGLVECLPLVDGDALAGGGVDVADRHLAGDPSWCGAFLGSDHATDEPLEVDDLAWRDGDLGGGFGDASASPVGADGAVVVAPSGRGFVLVALVFAGGGVAGEVGGDPLGVERALEAPGVVDAGAGSEVAGVAGADDVVPRSGEPVLRHLPVDPCREQGE